MGTINHLRNVYRISQDYGLKKAIAYDLDVAGQKLQTGILTYVIAPIGVAIGIGILIRDEIRKSRLEKKLSATKSK